MPIYEYVCADCGQRFDRLQRLADPDPACPLCGARAVRRAISLIGGLTGADSSPATSSGCGCGGACACGRR